MKRWTEGELVAGRYRLEAPLGGGAQGAVWRAVDTAGNGARVAVKLSAGADARREAEALTRIEHPSLPRALDSGTLPDGVAWLVMTLVDAAPLGPGRDVTEVASAAACVAGALAALHEQGLVHGDVKPANVLARDGAAWLVDLGLAAAVSEGAPTSGTLRYLAPERLAGERGPASDLFALGVVLVEWLTGEHPFARDPDDAASHLAAAASRAAPREDVMARVPAPLRDAVAWLLARDPERRPASARAWLARWRRDASLPEASRDDADAALARCPLTGRDAELAAGAEALRRALSGDGLGVVVTGPSGAGRRRLVEELVRACRIEGAARGASPDVRAEVPAECERATLVVRVDADEDELARLAASIARLRRYGASPAPVALVASGAACPEGAEAVPLRPLERGAARALLAALSGAPVASATVDAWIDVTAGLPGRVVALAHAVGAARVSTASRDELYERAAALHRVRMVERVPTRARGVALALALAGGALPRAALAALPHDVAGDVAGALADLDALGFARVAADHVALVTAVDTAGVDEATLRAAARALSESLARVAPNAHSPRARAALAAGDAALAWRHAVLASTAPGASRAEGARTLAHCASAAPDRAAWALHVARARLASGDAAGALEALDEAPPTAARQALALDALRRAGRRDEARALADALSNSTDVDARALGAVALAREALERGDAARAGELVGPVVDDATRPHEVALRALEVAAMRATLEGDTTRAAELLERADLACLARGDLAERARVRSLAGTAAQRAGAHDEARRASHDAWSLACAAGDAHAAAVYTANVGAAELEAGALGEALRWITRATRALAALGRMHDLARALANEASLLAWIGDRTAARDAARRARDAAREVGDAVAEGFAEVMEADATDDAREAARQLLGAATRLAAAGDGARASEARARAATALLRAGAADEAASALEGADGDHALVALAQVELAVARGRSGRELEARLASARAAVARDPAADHDLALLRAEASVARARGDREGAASADEALGRRVALLASTLPAAQGRMFARAHGPREASGGGARDASRWRRLVAVTQRLNDEPRLRSLLEVAVDAVVELTGASRGFVLLAGDDGALRIRTARNIGERDLEGDEMAFSRSVAEHVARAGEALVTVDASSDGRFHASASVTTMQLRSILAVPLRVHGEVVGTVYVDDRFRVGAFDDDAVEVARAFADAAAVAIHNARARAELQRALRRAERLSEELERRVDAQRVELEAVRKTLAQDAARGRYEGIVGRGAAMARLLALVDRVAPTGMPVLLRGESGTGKELVARAIHANSARAQAAFVAENCGAIPETLLESVLFGHVKGAFTGADRNRAGLFEVADGGTLFLDEVGEMSPAMQAKLLRVLQDGEVRPVGGERARRVDVRVIAATHRDLQEMVKRGAFREDLYYRLAVMVLPVPALRERREDIPALVAHFLAAGSGPKVDIDRKAMARLAAAPWPGNVRQLQNEIQRAAVMADGIIREEDLSDAVTQARAQAAGADGAEALDLRHAVADVERDLVERALREHGWNQSRAAKALGLSRFGLQKKLKRLGIPSRDPQAKPRA